VVGAGMRHHGVDEVLADGEHGPRLEVGHDAERPAPCGRDYAASTSTSSPCRYVNRRYDWYG
jgi:hypothetical protein